MISAIVAILSLTFVILLLFFAGVGVKILVRKRGEFKRHCSTTDPYSGKSGDCHCGAADLCSEKKNHPYQPLEVNKEMLDEAGVVPPPNSPQ